MRAIAVRPTPELSGGSAAQRRRPPVDGQRPQREDVRATAAPSQRPHRIPPSETTLVLFFCRPSPIFSRPLLHSPPTDPRERERESEKKRNTERNRRRRRPLESAALLLLLPSPSFDLHCRRAPSCCRSNAILARAIRINRRRV